MDDLFQYTSRGEGLWRSSAPDESQGFKVFQAATNGKSLQKLKVITRSAEAAKRIFARLYGVEPWQVVIWYSYPLQA